MIVPVILCGGSGTRLWPLSRNSYPKQFLPLITKHSMLQDTLLRHLGIVDISNPILICNEVHRFIVAEQLQQIDILNPTIILEPVGKNTAPAVTISALQAMSENRDAFLLVLPSDHIIKNEENYFAAIAQAKELADENRLVTFGIKPTHPETGYGYIKKGNAFTVEKFVEKPNLETAISYIASQKYFWNSGMFLFKASCFLNEMKKLAPDILNTCENVFSHMQKDLDFLRLNKEIFSSCRNESIDYAVMEKSNNIAVVPLDAQWSDVGSWNAMYEVREKDAMQNVVMGDVSLNNVSNSFVHAEHRLLSVVGVKDHIIVETVDAVLVAHKDHCQNVKNLVDDLKSKKRNEIDIHRKVFRPWGYYEVLDSASHFLVKRIMVKPGARLSLQAHKNRSEHWVVISGIATVTRNEETLILKENESTYISIGDKHRLVNEGKDPLIIIEVQCGSLISEDDIIRYDDIYGRAEVIN